MKRLPLSTLADSKRFIWSHCSKLSQTLFTHYIEEENDQAVIDALRMYQNEDGGFGHNLEGDFELPDSSPMATSVAFQILCALKAEPDEPIVQSGIQYLVRTYQPDRKGWITVPPQVNDYPHAGWWTYNEAEGGSVIDHNWGNPSAELVGYLLRYPQHVPNDLLEQLYQHTKDYLTHFSGKMEMHELYCFLRFFENMSGSDFQSVQEKLTGLVLNAVTRDPTGWEAYSAQPLDFVKHPDSFLYAPLKEDVQANLDYWIDRIQGDGTWRPNWEWDQYPDAWLKARVEISGRMTVARLNILKEFNRLDQ